MGTEVADTVIDHRLVARIAQEGLAVARMVVVRTVVDIALAEEQRVYYHTLHKSEYQQHFACHMHYKRQAHSYSVHNGYKTQCLLEPLGGKLDKDVS